MGKCCCAINCKNRFNKYSQISFYRLPKCQEKRRKWIAAIGRLNWNPTSETWLCSSHFVSGKKSNDPLHPDYVPSIFSFTSATEYHLAFNNVEQYVRSQKLRELNNTASYNTTSYKTVESSQLHQNTEVLPSDLSILQELIRYLKSKFLSLGYTFHGLESHLESDSTDNESFDCWIKFFTGLPNVRTVMLLFTYVSPSLPEKTKLSLRPVQELFLTLMKLRLDFSEEFLGHLFGIRQTTASCIFRRWIHVMSIRLYPLIMWPGRKYLQRSLKLNCICIIDCFEVFIEPPKGVMALSQTWSTSKQSNTIKFVISITPQGSISFISKAWGGCVPNRHLIENCGLLDKLLPGDLLLAYCPLTTEEDQTDLICAEVVMSPLSQGEKQLQQKDVEGFHEASPMKTHAQRVIGLLRERYSILSSTLPVSVIRVWPSGEVEKSLIDRVMMTCCALCNLCETIVPSSD